MATKADLQHAEAKELEWSRKAVAEKQQRGRTAYFHECIGQAEKWSQTATRIYNEVTESGGLLK